MRLKNGKENELNQSLLLKKMQRMLNKLVSNEDIVNVESNQE